jgi:hypothetical protein
VFHRLSYASVLLVLVCFSDSLTLTFPVLSSNHGPPISTYQVAETTGMCHLAQPSQNSFIGIISLGSLEPKHLE